MNTHGPHHFCYSFYNCPIGLPSIWPIIFPIHSPFMPLLIQSSCFHSAVVSQSLHRVNLLNNIEPLCWTWRVTFKTVSCYGLFTSILDWYFEKIQVLLLTSSVWNQTKVQSPGVPGYPVGTNNLWITLSQNPCNFTRPKNVRVVGTYLPTWSPALLLFTDLFVFDVWCDEEANYILPSKLPPSLRVGGSLLLLFCT